MSMIAKFRFLPPVSSVSSWQQKHLMLERINSLLAILSLHMYSMTFVTSCTQISNWPNFCSPIEYSLHPISHYKWSSSCTPNRAIPNQTYKVLSERHIKWSCSNNCIQLHHSQQRCNLRPGKLPEASYRSIDYQKRPNTQDWSFRPFQTGWCRSIDWN